MTNTDELADLDKQIELKKQELAALKASLG